MSAIILEVHNMATVRGVMIVVKCKFCHQPFSASVADRNRGWARYCTKSCKAKEQEGRTGQYEKYLSGNLTVVEYQEGWDGHKDSF